MSQYLYVIASQRDGPVKLGVSADPDLRRAQLQTGHPNKLVVYHRELVEGGLTADVGLTAAEVKERVGLLERLLHRDYRPMRILGEWYQMSVCHAVAYVQHNMIRYDGLTTPSLRAYFPPKRSRPVPPGKLC